ncbi:polysaccharide biosynthesis protein [Nocardioides aurantiacus]|uniref:FlaA1/EpsC-like NDP-sugar epimerase n=1 Tax=Nocardioides aurantiacus TaxID=86796 RepID=A0A3N2CYA9_9ACTN|nr:nucleoside-diphosphate sugar epimerase/dehydratase [Nocardioides aurantiacus]ROR92530.1 FlaA1/EpsC-like NDP-sugar epimerase [Nocardioides aurantiacus]
MQDAFSRIRQTRTLVLVTYDSVSWLVAFAAMALLQVAVGYSPTLVLPSALVLGVSCAIAYVGIGLPLHLHLGRSPVGSFADAVLASLVSGLVGLFVVTVNLAVGAPARVSLTVTASMLAFVLVVGGRAAYRLLRDWSDVRRLVDPATREPVVVIGAGNGAAQLVASMLRDPDCGWRPVALVDDDPRKSHRRLSGVPVVGSAFEFVEVARRVGATTAILAIPSAPSELVSVVSRLATESRIDLKVLPSVSNLHNPAHVNISDVRDIDVTDFLGRQPIETDVESIADYLTGKRVLVTGAGGSIGSELCRQIAKFGPSELIMLDRDESALHAVQLSITGRAMLDSDDTELGDIRDERYVKALFARRAPHVVFHAAALKHLPLLEAAPGEAVKTNVWGTQHVLAAAVATGVERFVNVSTDKAANPCSVLGYSKRLAEGLTAAAARDAEGLFMSVRFGNVLGSRGSVLTTFTAQIAAGGPITVTDPRVTRYFMTIREAVQLVIQAGAIGSRGDVMVLDMGEPIAIRDVAQQLIALSGKQVDVVFTGLREGEKMHEELFGDDELDVRPQHPLISHAAVPDFSPVTAEGLDPYQAPSVVSRTLAQACAGMRDDLARRSATTVVTGRSEPPQG